MWHHFRGGMAPCPPLSLFGDTYVADYSGAGSAPHYLFRYGIFGMSERLKKSDVLLLGSSHVQMGFSAAQLGEALSAENKRPVRVYNLGLGFTEGIGFDREILRANDLRNKTVLVDLFQPNGEDISAYGKKVEGASALSAYLRVLQMWTTCAGDELLDPFLPRFYPQDVTGATTPGLPPPRRILGVLVAPRRYLLTLTTRSWETGDVALIWTSVAGTVSVDPPEPLNVAYGKGEAAYNDLTNTGVFFPAQEQGLFREFNLKAIYTLLPYEGFRSAKVPAEATPYVALAPEGLKFYDGMHLTAESRVLATELLILGLRADGLAELPPQELR